MQEQSNADQPLNRRKYPSGAERRRRRVNKGLPPYLAGDLVARRNDYQKNEQARRNARRAKRTALIRAIKLERGCADCGYSAHPAALDFDHLPEFEKSLAIAEIHHATSMSTLLAEIAKCEVVCANCHRIRTYERRMIRGLPEPKVDEGEAES